MSIGANQNKNQSAPAFQSVGQQVQDVDTEGGDATQKVVEEIESFCVNCEQNVGPSLSLGSRN
jgi:hypothetical protein